MDILPINQKLLDAIDEITIDRASALFFCFSIAHPTHGLLEELIDKDLLTTENEHLFRINFCVTDEDGNVTLRYPLYVDVPNDKDFDLFIQGLIDAGMQLQGFSYNLQDYTVLTSDEETRLLFARFKMSTDDFNLEKLIQATANYYQQTAKAKSLKSFLKNDASIAYKIAQ